MDEPATQTRQIKKREFSSKAFKDEPRVFVRYRPVAEKILCLAVALERSGEISEEQSDFVRMRVQGDTMPQIISTTGFTRSRLKHMQGVVFARLSNYEAKLIQDYGRIRGIRQSYRARMAHLREYRSTLDAKEKRLKVMRDYYLSHREEIRRWQSDYHKQYIARPGVKERSSISTKEYKERRRDSRSYVRDLDSLNPDTRYVALMAIEERRYRGAFDKIMRLLLTDPYEQVRRAAASAIGGTRDWRGDKALIKVAAHAASGNDTPMLMTAISALGKLGTLEARRTIRSYLDHPNELVREKAKNALLWRWPRGNRKVSGQESPR